MTKISSLWFDIHSFAYDFFFHSRMRLILRWHRRLTPEIQIDKTFSVFLVVHVIWHTTLLEHWTFKTSASHGDGSSLIECQAGRCCVAWQRHSGTGPAENARLIGSLDPWCWQCSSAVYLCVDSTRRGGETRHRDPITGALTSTQPSGVGVFSSRSRRNVLIND